MALVVLLHATITGGCSGGDGDLGEGRARVTGAALASLSSSVTTCRSLVPPPSGSSGPDVYVVAHPDDDLLFVNPDIEESIVGRRPTTTIFLTAGDPGTCPECWSARENGIFNAYTAMANVTKDWSCEPVTYPGGKTVQRCALVSVPTVKVVFVRLPDRPAPSLTSLWFTDGGHPFFETPVDQLSAVDGSSTYTKSELVELLAAIYAEIRPVRIGTQDSSFAHGEDHWDHISGALFALEAAHAYPCPRELKMYRGYNIYGNYFTSPAPEPANLTQAQYTQKVRIMTQYGGAFPVDSDFDRWCQRRYSIDKVPSGVGPIVQANGLCLDASGGAVQAATCAGSDAQSWLVAPNGLIWGEGDQCLTVGHDGITVWMAPCAGSAQQKWTLMNNGQLRGVNGTCLGVATDGITVEAQFCEVDTTGPKYFPIAAQRWSRP